MRVASNKAKAFELRAQGLTHQKIADELGVNLRTAYRLIKAGIQEHPIEAIEAHREKHLAKLTLSEQGQLAIIHKFLPIALNDDGLKAVEAAGVVHAAEASLARIRDQIAKLLGLNAPERTAVATFDVSTSPSSARQVMADLFGSVGPKDPVLATNVVRALPVSTADPPASGEGT